MKSCLKDTHYIEGLLGSNPVKMFKETGYEKIITYFTQTSHINFSYAP